MGGQKHIPGLRAQPNRTERSGIGDETVQKNRPPAVGRTQIKAAEGGQVQSPNLCQDIYGILRVGTVDKDPTLNHFNFSL